MSKFVADRIYKMQDENGNIVVSFVVSGSNKWAANMSVEELKKLGKTKLSIDVKKYKSHRSIEQNKMLWALCEKLAIAISGVSYKSEVEDCYVNLLEEANIEGRFRVVLPEDRKQLEEEYRVVKSVGKRMVENPKNNKKTECEMFLCYKGSSTFDTKQMTELIELALNRCADLGVHDSEIQQIMEDNRRYEK